ncbi:hypothetical protein CCHL11_04141 [Colletotrichum chlorophyti]|uniref:Hypersensitive response-inducing protein n=1 Tax=Colletotrichum chlorophyti TaxID=708187 RepID=A0A1Q8RPL1_9PEZI|nr:hypothetical protein CCHL11_04141 [Colletotrichum chlorophyti]
MKFAAILSAVAVASAAVIEPRDEITVRFVVRDFVANCIPHSTRCQYVFNVIEPNSMDTTGANCSAIVPVQADGRTLPDVKDGTCKDSSRTFDITRSDAGLTITVSRPDTPSSNTTASHLLPKEDFKIPDTPNLPFDEVESYVGPTTFNLE